MTIFLTLIKLGTAFISNSVGVLSEGVHSFLDLVSAALSWFTVVEAGKPADKEHPFGHGKIETLSSLFEALLLVLAALLISYEGVSHFRHPEPIFHQRLAILVMIFSLGVNILAYLHNSKAARQTESRALAVNALHFLSDIVASLGVLLGLIVMELTGWLWIDPLIAFMVAGYILLVSGKQVREALLELVDVQLPEKEIETIQDLLKDFSSKIIETHDLRTRKSGSSRHIDFHLVVCGRISVDDSHAVCDEIETKMNQVFSNSSISIHVEPCERERTQCHLTCQHFKNGRQPS